MRNVTLKGERLRLGPLHSSFPEGLPNEYSAFSHAGAADISDCQSGETSKDYYRQDTNMFAVSVSECI